MATPRKHYFRVLDSILHEPWPVELKGVAVNLMAYLNTRWAREGLTPEQACSAVLSPAACMLVTGSQRLVKARSLLRRLAVETQLKVSERGADTLIRWPKFSETQGYTPLKPPRDFPGNAPSASASASAPADAEEAEKKKNSPRDGEAPSPLLRLLKNLPGDEAEKRAFLADEGPQIEVDSAATGKAVASLTVRYYRSYLKRGRRFQHAAEEAEREAKRRAWHEQHGAAYDALMRETGGVA